MTSVQQPQTSNYQPIHQPVHVLLGKMGVSNVQKALEEKQALDQQKLKWELQRQQAQTNQQAQVSVPSGIPANDIIYTNRKNQEQQRALQTIERLAKLPTPNKNFAVLPTPENRELLRQLNEKDLPFKRTQSGKEYTFIISLKDTLDYSNLQVDVIYIYFSKTNNKWVFIYVKTDGTKKEKDVSLKTDQVQPTYVITNSYVYKDRDLYSFYFDRTTIYVEKKSPHLMSMNRIPAEETLITALLNLKGEQNKETLSASDTKIEKADKERSAQLKKKEKTEQEKLEREKSEREKKKREKENQLPPELMESLEAHVKKVNINIAAAKEKAALSAPLPPQIQPQSHSPVTPRPDKYKDDLKWLSENFSRIEKKPIFWGWGWTNKDENKLSDILSQKNFAAYLKWLKSASEKIMYVNTTDVQTGISNRTDLGEQSKLRELLSLMHPNKNVVKTKYLKYKMKYLKLKKELNI